MCCTLCVEIKIKISKWTIALHAENLSANFSVYEQAHMNQRSANAFVIYSIRSGTRAVGETSAAIELFVRLSQQRHHSTNAANNPSCSTVCLFMYVVSKNQIFKTNENLPRELHTKMAQNRFCRVDF